MKPAMTKQPNEVPLEVAAVFSARARPKAGDRRRRAVARGGRRGGPLTAFSKRLSPGGLWGRALGCRA